MTKLFVAVALMLLAVGAVEAANSGDYSHTCTCTQWNNNSCAQWSCSGSFAIDQAKCFPEDASVLIDSTTGATKLMRDLKVGDQIVGWDFANNQPVVDTVYAFIHRFVDTQAKMTEFTLSNGNKLVASAEHLLFACDGSAVLGEAVKVGDKLKSADDSCHSVLNVVQVKGRGMYAPATHTGTLVVNGVVASNYAVVDSHTWAHLSFAPLRAWSKLSSFFSSSSSSATTQEETASGIHPYARVLMGVYGVEEVREVEYSAELSSSSSAHQGFKLTRVRSGGSTSGSSSSKQNNDFVYMLIMATQRSVFSF